MSLHDEELCVVITRMALAGDGLVLGLGMAVLALRTWLKFRSHSKALTQVQETPLTSIEDLRSLILQKDDKRSSDTRELVLRGSPYPIVSSKDLSTPKMVKPTGKSSSSSMVHKEKLVIVRGRVYTKESVDSRGRGSTDGEALVPRNGNEKGVYLEKTQTYVHTEMNSLLGYITQKDLVTLTRRMVPFVLAGNEVHRNASSKLSEGYVHVQLDDPPKHSLPLVTVYHKLHPVPTSSYTFFQAMFGRRYPVGLLDEEKILPVGKEITAIGLLGATADGNPVIYSCKNLPCFLTDGTREQLEMELAAGTRVLMWTGIAMSAVAIGILGYAFTKNWTKYKARQRERRRREDDQRQDENLSVEYELEDVVEVPDGELCIVCLLRRRRAAFIFCGHRVCCVSCAQRVEQGANPRCPVCRQSVSGYIRVFDS